MSEQPEPAFSEPWHAQLFALTVHLNETGVFTWPDWAARFSAVLAQHGLAKELNGGDDYFNAWLEALEGLLSDADVADAQTLATLKNAWTEAFLRTPHGAPVYLDR